MAQPTLREFLGFCLDRGWPRESLRGLARIWKRFTPSATPGTFVVKYQQYVIPRKFSSRKAAADWAEWNYKGGRGWKVLRYVPRQHGNLQ